MGVSQGANGHFLFYGSGSGFAGPATGYYCFASTDAEAQYQAKFTAHPPAESGDGEVIGAESPCLAYKEGAGGIDALLAAHPLWGPGDVTFDPATFTGGGPRPTSSCASEGASSAKCADRFDRRGACSDPGAG